MSNIRPDKQLSQSKPLILVVHADTAHARPIERLLEGAGYQVVSAGEIDDLLSLGRRGRPDLVVVREEDIAVLPREIRNGEAPLIVVGRENNSDGALHCPLHSLVETVASYFQHTPSAARK